MSWVAWLAKMLLCGGIVTLGVGAWTHGYHVGGVILVIVGLVAAARTAFP